ncbi:peptidylprolyl isomerase [Ferrimicrobium sp.]|uniref:peptidylprolyl isomerase n=1 Tax=Ferrimicrobium sp. TaxID=2926050 RepID=UPI00261E5D7B|nr:peptidylprolyl isomerase [Ferrimicrobium sp.]
MLGKKKESYPCPEADGSSPQVRHFDASPSYCLEDNATYEAIMETNHGTMRFELFPERAPITVNSFVFLARYHYFDGINFHRIIPGFVVQGGDPTGSGAGGPGYKFRDELPNAGEYQRGSLAMANAGPNTNGSQFFIISGPSGVSLPPLYSLFGQLKDGDDVITSLDSEGTPGGNPKQACTITSVVVIQESRK